MTQILSILAGLAAFSIAALIPAIIMVSLTLIVINLLDAGNTFRPGAELKFAIFLLVGGMSYLAGIAMICRHSTQKLRFMHALSILKYWPEQPPAFVAGPDNTRN
jgi:hypothetical protein